MGWASARQRRLMGSRLILTHACEVHARAAMARIDEGHHAALIEFEKALESSLTGGTNVDGHDMGSDEMNIFVETDNPARTFAEVEAAMKMSSLWNDMRAAYREIEGDD